MELVLMILYRMKEGNKSLETKSVGKIHSIHLSQSIEKKSKKMTEELIKFNQTIIKSPSATMYAHKMYNDSFSLE